jgi:raffinose/stachyose/melibiose transport system substrate-binding protein
MAAAAVTAALLAAGCGARSGGANGSKASPVTITIWHNYGTEQNATALDNLAKAFEKLHPAIKVTVVSQDASNYFAHLQTAAISRDGPDLAVMWTGLFALKYKAFLTNLATEIPAADLARINPDALRWTTDGFDAANGPYVIPLEDQFYIGFYNKADFTRAGVTSVPTDWSQLYAACAKLKKAGFTPLVYGNGGQPLGATFYPWYDMSYLMIGAYSVTQWKSLYSGQIPWTSPAIAGQLDDWGELHSSGCTNPDVMTNTGNLGQFESGKAAMMVDGTWDTQKFTNALHGNVAAFVPPFSDTPIKGVVDFAGDGISQMSYSRHPVEDAMFLRFMTTPEAAHLINAAGLIPAINGVSTTNPVNQQMLNFVDKDHMIVYPMLDNVVQPDVVSAGQRFLPAVLGGKESAQAAMQALAATLDQLPANERGNTFP